MERARDIELAASAPPRSDGERLRIVSGVFHLAGFSELHEGYGPGVLEARIGPALDLGQFHYHTDAHGLPVAFCNWVWLSPNVLADVSATGRDLAPAEFRCGELPFFYELLAPFGGVREVVRALRSRTEFMGRAIPAIRGRRPDGGPLLKTFRF